MRDEATPGYAEAVACLDRITSAVIRGRYMEATDAGPRCRCWTCGREMSWHEATVGHYIGRWWYKTRWDPRNLRPQCKDCNHAREGEHFILRQRISEEIGERQLREMEQAALSAGHRPPPLHVILRLIDQATKEAHDAKRRYSRSISSTEP